MATCTDGLLEAYLIRLIEDADLRERIGSNAPRYVLANYRVENCAAKYLRVIEETVGARDDACLVSHVVEQVAELEIDDHGSEDFLPSLGREIATLVPIPEPSQVPPALTRNGHPPNAKPLAAADPKEPSPVVSKAVYAGNHPDNEHRHGRIALVDGLDYERGALDYVQNLDDEHRYYLRTKPFFNLAGKPPKAFLDLDNRPPKYEGDGLDIESHRHICDFANMAARLALPPASTILDVGCGQDGCQNGLRRLWIQRHRHRYQPRPHRDPRKRLRDLSYGADHETGLRYRFETLNIERAALDEHFDAVICYDSLHHFVDEHATMKNLARMTKPGGTLFILEGDKPPENSAAASELSRVMRKYSTLESPFDPLYLRELLAEYGFKVVGDYVSVNGLYPRDSLEEGDRLPVRGQPVNYLLCKKVVEVRTRKVCPTPGHPTCYRPRSRCSTPQ